MQTRDVTASTNKFWVVAKAMAGFVDAEGGGLLPQCAVLPDLTATAEWYIRLQKIYKAKVRCRCSPLHVPTLTVVFRCRCAGHSGRRRSDEACAQAGGSVWHWL